MIDHRAFLAALGPGALASPPVARAQQAGTVPVVGVLSPGVGRRSVTIDTTRQGLRDLGYVEGRTIVLDVRFAGMKQGAFRQKASVLLVSGPAADSCRTAAPSPPSSSGWPSLLRRADRVIE